jgi:hypothetical protein
MTYSNDQCCERDTNFDGNCDIHLSREKFRNLAMNSSDDENWNITLSSEVEAKQLAVFLEYLYPIGYAEFYKVVMQYADEPNDQSIY